VPVKIDLEGMIPTGPGSLEDVLENWDDSKGQRPHMMYTVTYVLSTSTYNLTLTDTTIALVKTPPVVLFLFRDAKNYMLYAVNTTL
jgi:hypothetical protein